MVLRDGHCSGEAIGTGPAVRYVAFSVWVVVWVVVVDEEPAYGALSCVARCVVRLCCTAPVLGNHTPLEAGLSSILCRSCVDSQFDTLLHIKQPGHLSDHW